MKLQITLNPWHSCEFFYSIVEYLLHVGMLRVKENKMHLISWRFFLFWWVFKSMMWFFSKENSFPNFAVTLSVITRIVFRCVPLSCIFLKVNKNTGSSRRRTFLFKYLSLICEFCIKNTNKSDGIDHHITEVGLKHVWPLRKRAEPYSLTMFSPYVFCSNGNHWL